MASSSFLYRESGLRSVVETGKDAWLVIFSRSSRVLACSMVSVILALFFAELGTSDYRIGLFMSLTLAGDSVLGLLLTLVADSIGRRFTLAIGGLLMILSGVAFCFSENFWILLAAAVVGVVSINATDCGPFRVIEESILSEITNPLTRADVLSWHVMLMTFSSALGTAGVGVFLEWLQARGWTLLSAYHAAYSIYLVTGTFNLFAAFSMSSNCELKSSVDEVRDGIASQTTTSTVAREDEDATESTSLLADRPTEGPVAAAPLMPSSGRNGGSKKKGVITVSQISRETIKVIYPLTLLQILESFADGMAGLAFTTYYLDRKFHPSKTLLGSIFSVCYFVGAAFTMFGGSLSRRIGLVNTMVFTHVPSSTAVLLYPFPSSLSMAMFLLLVRIALNNMDQAPRTALIAALVRKEERTSVLGVTNILRTLSSSLGPVATGILAGRDLFWVAFVVAGALRLVYDFGIFAMFLNVTLYEHESIPEQPKPLDNPEEPDSTEEQEPADER